jgi:hypothetical protein
MLAFQKLASWKNSAMASNYIDCIPLQYDFFAALWRLNEIETLPQEIARVQISAVKVPI